MSRTENRYGQATIEPGATKPGLAYALYRAIDDAVDFNEGVCLFDQIQISSEILVDEERTFSGTHRTNERNVLTVRLPVVFDD